MTTIKECSCGKSYDHIPVSSRLNEDDIVGTAFWWECEGCKNNTLCLPMSKLKENPEAEKRIIEGLVDQLLKMPSIANVNVMHSEDLEQMARTAGE